MDKIFFNQPVKNDQRMFVKIQKIIRLEQKI